MYRKDSQRTIKIGALVIASSLAFQVAARLTQDALERPGSSR